MDTPTIDNDIDQLNKLLRGERAAVETYEQCIDKVSRAPIVQQLRTLETSHRARVLKLSERILLLGGEPEDSSGAWGSFAKMIEGGAKAFGEKAAIAALEQGEDHGKKEYADLDDLTIPTRRFVEQELVPEQRRTHDMLSHLQSAM